MHVNGENNLYLSAKYVSRTYPGRLGDRHTGLGAKLWRPNNTFQVLFFQLYFNKKYVEVAINDFTMHLRRQKCKQKRKTMRQKDIERKKKLSTKAFLMLAFSS